MLTVGTIKIPMPIKAVIGEKEQFCVLGILMEKSREEGKDQESIQSSTTPDPGYHMGK